MLSYSDFVEVASGEYLTKLLPTDHTEWDDDTLQSFIEENVVEFFETTDWNVIYELIDDNASAFWYLYKNNIGER